MERPRILRAMLDEIPLKVVSLVIAVTLFVIVRSDKDAATGAFVKVIYALPEDEVLVSDPVGEVRVGVRGPWTRLQRFDEHALEPIRVDLSKAEDGLVHFDESMIKLPVGLQIASITPSEVRVKFEPRAHREVPIQPILDGEPAEGFRVNRVSADPQTVMVEGAKSAVETLQHVLTRPLEVAGARAEVTARVGLAELPRHVHFVDVSEVSVRAEVKAAMVERTFDALPVRVSGLSRLDGEVDPKTARLILRGPSDLVAAVKPEQLSLSVDAQLVDTRPPSRYARALAVSGLPAGVAAELQPDSVTLTTHHRH
ncbi:MAG: YbbR-like domain-containing protein [Polyangia bacterium]|jgi:YbbR domain-containing protein